MPAITEAAPCSASIALCSDKLALWPGHIGLIFDCFATPCLQVVGTPKSLKHLTSASSANNSLRCWHRARADAMRLASRRLVTPASMLTSMGSPVLPTRLVACGALPIWLEKRLLVLPCRSVPIATVVACSEPSD